MLSVDTNILFHAHNPESPNFNLAKNFMREITPRRDIVICELALAELYVLLRNPKVNKKPLGAEAAVSVCQFYRQHPSWEIVESAMVMDSVWRIAAQENFAIKKIYDVRLAKTLQYHGVDEFATANVKDFQNLGFKRVWNPLA